MNSAIEEGVRQFLIAKLSATSQTVGEGNEELTVTAATFGSTPNGPSLVSLHTFISDDVRPEAIPWIVCVVRDLESPVLPLWDGKLSIVVSSPIRIAPITKILHDEITAAVRACMVDAFASALNTAVVTAADFSIEFVPEASLDSVQNNRWQADLNFKIGLQDLS